MNEHSTADMHSNSYEADFRLPGFPDKKPCFAVKWHGSNEIFVLEYILTLLPSFLSSPFTKCARVFWISTSEINKRIRVALHLFA